MEAALESNSQALCNSEASDPATSSAFPATARSRLGEGPSRSGSAVTSAVTSEVLFRARPSLCGKARSILQWLAVLAGAVLLEYFPLEEIVSDLLALNLAENQVLLISRYRAIAGAGLAAIAAVFLLIKIIRLKATCYEITADRIEWSRGILSRRFDNLDMFRVVDLKLHRSLFDCILGIGKVTLITTDKTDPEFEFEKMRKPRQLYDVIKKSSLEAARQGGVFHLEQN